MKTLSLSFELDHDEIRGQHVPAHGIRGTVRLDDHIVSIDYRLERGPAEGGGHARIPLADVKKLVMTGGVLKSPRLLIEVNDGGVLKDVPWAVGCMAVLRFRRADGVRLGQLIEEAEVRMARIRTGGRSQEGTS